MLARSVIEYGPFRDAEGGDSAKDAVTSLGRGKAARQHVRVRLTRPRAGDESPRSPRDGDALRVPFPPLSSTVSDVMEVRLTIARAHSRTQWTRTNSLARESFRRLPGWRAIHRSLQIGSARSQARPPRGTPRARERCDASAWKPRTKRVTSGYVILVLSSRATASKTRFGQRLF